MMAENTDTTALTGEGRQVTLSTGTVVTVQRLKVRQTMSLLKIITRGAGNALNQLSFDADTDAAQFGVQLGATIIFAIPEAEDETIEFIQRMVAPEGLIEGKKLSKPEQEINEAKWDALVAELDNPELDDLVTIIEVVMEAEAPHLLALGKRLALLWSVQTKSETAKSSKKRAVSSKDTSND
jgi:hypothetical protein